MTYILDNSILLSDSKGGVSLVNQFSRTKIIYGKEAILKASKAHVAIFGIGGVGGYVVEALVRSGIQTFTLVDNDTIALTNCNRQIIATHDTIGKYKVDVMKDRILSINPNAKVYVHKCFFLKENQDEFDFTKYDYVVDAIDTISAKIALVIKAKEANVPIICAMGAGNKTNPMGFIVSDLYKTEMDPIAKVMRRELRKLNIKKVKVVYSKEIPVTPLEKSTEITNKREVPGSNAFVPTAEGLLIASEVFKDLISK